MKSYSQRKNEKLLREFVGPNGQIDPMAMGQPQKPGQPQQMGMNPAMGGQAGQMGQQMGMNPAMGGQAGQMGQMAQPQQPGMNPAMGGINMGDMSGAMGGQTGQMGDMSGAQGGEEMGDMSGAMGGQEAPKNPTDPAEDLPGQLNAAIRFMSGKSSQQIISFQQQFNQKIQQLLTKKSKSMGKRNLWNQFQATKDAKQNWGKPPADATAP